MTGDAHCHRLTDTGTHKIAGEVHGGDGPSPSKKGKTAEAAAEKAHAFVVEQQYEEAIRLLESTLRETPNEKVRIVLGETRRAALDYQRKLDATLSPAEKLLQARKANELATPGISADGVFPASGPRQGPRNGTQ